MFAKIRNLFLICACRMYFSVNIPHCVWHSVEGGVYGVVVVAFIAAVLVVAVPAWLIFQLVVLTCVGIVIAVVIVDVVVLVGVFVFSSHNLFLLFVYTRNGRKVNAFLCTVENEALAYNDFLGVEVDDPAVGKHVVVAYKTVNPEAELLLHANDSCWFLG